MKRNNHIQYISKCGRFFLCSKQHYYYDAPVVSLTCTFSNYFNKPSNILSISKLFLLLIFLFMLCSCTNTTSHPPLFTKLEPSQTHINFSNNLSYDDKFNIYTYRNFYNG